ncbi:protein KRI1 homolog isoform X2 [Nematostella vectensis]|uniref:protein KRI1 homolog isoform X2 n=1 Tax=Nematostella vectensis TaxID=45351 RepID=UPI00207779DE|nr:protein KRI1 homolog isoform X2 [Nematostella vectensis]
MADKEYKISVNREYAKRFEKNQQRAELHRLKAKYGESATADQESSSSETEDEDAEALTAQKEKDFLKVLAMLKKKDPKIYDKDATFYESDDSSSSNDKEKSKKPQKPMFLKDYERKRLLEKGSKAFVSDEESSDEDESENKKLTYDEEQKALKDSFKLAVNDEEEDDNGNFLKVRQKLEDEKKQEEVDYKEWLKGEKKRIDAQAAKEMDGLQRYWNDPNLDKDELFLRDYILDRKYIDKEDDRIPTYEEIVNEEDEDENEVEKQEEFERKYNFRFEEPDAAFIKSYPRTISASVRHKDERRKEARKQREERKKKEKEQKREEIKRMKNLKRKEIQDKLKKLKEITGNPNVGFTDEDVEGDFDPAKYDEAMKKVFDDEFYEEAEEEEPQFDNDDLDDVYEENWDEWQGRDAGGEGYAEDDYELGYDDPGFNMDADYDPTQDTESGKKKLKKKSKFAKALNKNKPLFDPNEKTFEEYFDEYYKLDYEDIIGDMPCRFKYRQVTPNDYGLSAEEVLKFPERELNQWVSVKKMSQYRSTEEEIRDLKKYRKLSNDEKRRRRIFTSAATESETNEEVRAAKSSNDRVDSGISQTDVTKSEANGSPRNQPHSHPKENTAKERTFQKDKQKAAFLQRKGWKRKLSAKEEMEMAKKRKLLRQFKGARKEKLAKLSAERLSAYGLNKKR